jgi:hypothetical protein
MTIENFSHLFIYAPSKRFKLSDLNLSFSVFREHGFGGFIGDSSSLPLVIDGKDNISNIYCSLGFPHEGLNKDIAMNSIIYLESIDVVNCDGFFMCLDRHDMETGDWESIRSFACEASAITEKSVYLLIDPLLCKNPEDISRIFSVISSYDNINPVIDVRADIDEHFYPRLKQFGAICKSSTTKSLTLYCPKLNKHSVAVNPQEYGFDNVIISPSMAVSISRDY